MTRFRDTAAMRTLVRVLQYGLVALILHFSVTILGQQSKRTDFFKADVADNFDDIYEKYISVTADNCHIRVCETLRTGFLDIISSISACQ